MPVEPLWYRLAPENFLPEFRERSSGAVFLAASPTLPIRAVAPLRDVNDQNDGLIVPDTAIDAIIERGSDRVTARPRYSSGPLYSWRPGDFG